MAERPREASAEDLALYRAIVGGDLRGRDRDRPGPPPPATGAADDDGPHVRPGWRRRVDGAVRLASSRFREGIARLLS